MLTRVSRCFEQRVLEVEAVARTKRKSPEKIHVHSEGKPAGGWLNIKKQDTVWCEMGAGEGCSWKERRRKRR